MLARYGDVLARIEAASGVPKEILVAIWGMETDYGARQRRLQSVRGAGDPGL